MTFQDILRLNEDLVTDPTLREIARHHRVEDGGHDRWFLSDLAMLGIPQPNASALFGREHEATRLASFALLSEVYRASSDQLRLIFLLTLESSGHIFFEEFASYLERMENAPPLQYFSRHHLNVEKSHALFGEENDAYLSHVTLSAETYEEARALIDRCYAAFMTILDGAEQHIQSAFSEARRAV
jgi:hypothetical protein